jgi:uncharacterized protein YggE
MIRFAPVLAFCALLAQPVLPALAGDEATVTVTGEASVAVVPDMATVSLGVSAEGADPAAALNAASAAMTSVLAALGADGIEAGDIRTDQLTLNPVWDQNQTSETGAPLIRGYAASNQVSVRVRDLARLGEVLGTVAGAGANTFNGIFFGLSDPAAATAEARRAAVADARARAELYTEAAGASLGDLRSISDVDSGIGQPMAGAMMRMEADASTVPVSAGELEVNARVTAIWTITGK